MACVEKRNGGYRITVYDGYSSNGKQVKKHKTWRPPPGMTAAQIKKELERQKVLFEDECKNGRAISEVIKFKDFADKWFDEYGAVHLRATTRSNYKQLSKRVNQSIGHIRIDQIKPRTLNDFYLELYGLKVNKCRSVKAKVDLKQLLKQKGFSNADFAENAGMGLSTLKVAIAGQPIACSSAEKIAKTLERPMAELFVPNEERISKLSPKTIRSYHGFISSVMERAVRWGYIPDNPCRRVDPPKVGRKRITCLSKEEAQHFLKNLANEHIEKQAIFCTLLFTGMRRGELLGLEWSDVDFKKNTISIQRTSLYTADDGLFTDTTKTESSKRTLIMSNELAEVLRRYKAYQDEMRALANTAWIESNRLFTEWNGAPMSTNKPYNTFQRLLKKYGLPKVSLHSLRHTNATIMIEVGTNLSTMSNRLGHSQTSTTLNIYVHEIRSADAQVAESLSKALSFE